MEKEEEEVLSASERRRTREGGEGLNQFVSSLKFLYKDDLCEKYRGFWFHLSFELLKQQRIAYMRTYIIYVYICFVYCLNEPALGWLADSPAR